MKSEGAVVAVEERGEERVEERVEERLMGVFYVGDVVWFQRSKKPQRAEIIEVVPVDPVVGVTSAASIQGYMIQFLSLTKASKIKFTLPEYIRLEDVEEEIKEVKKMVEKMVEKVEKVEKVEDNFNLTPIAQQDEAKKEDNAKAAAVQVQTTATAAVVEEKSTAVSETKIVPMEAAPPVVPRRKSRLVISDSD